MDALIDRRRLALVGVVLAELLRGAARQARATRSFPISHLAGLHFLADSFMSWRRAGELSASLRRRGLTLPLSDLVIAAIALEHGCQVFTLDHHFRQIPGV